MKETKLTCDCGCEATVTNLTKCGWFVISQLEYSTRDLAPKIERELYFSTLECLKKWTEKAIAVVPSLQSTATCLHPRSQVSSGSVAGLFV